MRSFSYVVYLAPAVPSLKQHPATIVFIGIKTSSTENTTAIRFGRSAYFGMPAGSKLDHVKLPKL